MSGMSCPRNGQLTHTKERPVRTAGKIQKSPTGCADRYSSNNCVPAFDGTAFIGVQRGHPLPPFPLPLPLSLEGFPKGRNRSFAPLCRFKGVRGEIEIPPRFSLGGWGDILFSKENIPLASPYRNGTVPPGTPVIFSARRKENGDSIRCGIAAHLRTNLVRLISQKKSSAFCGGNRPPLREQEPAKGHPGSAAYSCTGGRPGPGSARRWGWRGCGCPPPPRSGW